MSFAARIAARFATRRRWLTVALLAVGQLALAASPTLSITTDAGTRKYTTEALLAHPGVTTISIAQDVSYKRPMTYRAIPIALLLSGVSPDDTLRFVANDGFVATMPAAPLLASSDSSARAYLAIEPPGALWPALKAGSKATAGPFYLVWLRPELSRIVPEQWPYQIADIQEVAPLTTRFPALLPAASVPAGDPVRRGLKVFTTNCMVCHTLNLAGDAKVGPDLNVPFSPTEYMREEFMRRQIRNPASLRYWPEQKMPAFDSTVLSERDLDDLVAYLYYMAKRKVEVPKAR